MLSKKEIRDAALFLCCILFAGMLAGCSSNSKDSARDGEVKTKVSGGQTLILDDRAQEKSEAVEQSQNPLADRNVFFAGYSDATIHRKSTVALENLPENEDFLIRYIITDLNTGEVVFETNLIQSGQCVIWTPGETLKPGVYDLQFLAVPYYMEAEDSFITLTSGSNEVQYTVLEE